MKYIFNEILVMCNDNNNGMLLHMFQQIIDSIDQQLFGFKKSIRRSENNELFYIVIDLAIFRNAQEFFI